MTYFDFLISFIHGSTIESLNIFAEAAPYLLLGFAVAGLLKIFLPDEKIIEYLGSSAGRVRSVLNASIAGVPLPLCSCGVVPAALSLKRRGATKGATLSFLISTPETGVDSISITYALLDPIMTIFRPVATFITASAAGIAENILEKDKPVPTPRHILDISPTSSISEDVQNPCSCENECCTTQDSETLYQKLGQGARYAYIDLVADISKWLVIGIVLAGMITYIMPSEIMQAYLGGGVASMLIMLVIGIPLYICATASTPLAAAFIAAGVSPGAAFVFLLAGPATNAATITMVAKFLGTRTAMIYISVIAICSIIFGLLLDYIYSRMGIEATAIVGSASDLLPAEVKAISAAILGCLIIYATYLRNYRKTCTGKV